MKSAPSFYLTAIGASRIVGGPPGPATPLLLIFHDHAGAQTAFEINHLLRTEFPDIERLQIASVVGLHRVPRFMRSTVEQTLHAAYQDAAAAIPPTHSPTEYVLIVPDWEGKVSNAFGMDDTPGQVSIALVVPPWKTFGTYSGEEPEMAALHMVRDAINVPEDTTNATDAPP